MDGECGRVNLPKGAGIIDLNGKAVMPGLVMLHQHMYILGTFHSSSDMQI